MCVILYPRLSQCCHDMSPREAFKYCTPANVCDHKRRPPVSSDIRDTGTHGCLGCAHTAAHTSCLSEWYSDRAVQTQASRTTNHPDDPEASGQTDNPDNPKDPDHPNRRSVPRRLQTQPDKSGTRTG